VAAGPVVDPRLVHRQDVGRAEERVGGIHDEGGVVKSSRAPRHDRYVVWRRPLPEPRGDRRALRVHEHLAHAELEDFLEELDGLGGSGAFTSV